MLDLLFLQSFQMMGKYKQFFKKEYLNFNLSRSMWDSYTLGIRCPTDGSTCAALAKEPVTEEDQVRSIYSQNKYYKPESLSNFFFDPKNTWHHIVDHKFRPRRSLLGPNLFASKLIWISNHPNLLYFIGEKSIEIRYILRFFKVSAKLSI